MPKTILITGANGNLGSEVVKVLYEIGHQIIAALGPGTVPQEFSEWTAAREEVNLLNEQKAGEFVENTLQIHPSLNVAILLVGGFAMADIVSTDESMLDKQISLNFKSAFFLVKPLLKHFKQSGGGEFVLIGARPAVQPADAGSMIAYALSKSMVIQLADIINAAYKKEGIRASVIIPSIIDTPANREAMPDADFSSWVKPEAIAQTMQYILSEAGQNLRQPVFKMYNRS